MAFNDEYGIGGYDTTKPNNNLISRVFVDDALFVPPPTRIQLAHDRLDRTQATIDQMVTMLKATGALTDIQAQTLAGIEQAPLPTTVDGASIVGWI